MHGKFTLPIGHLPAMTVPIPGASCNNCKFFQASTTRCKNTYYSKWSGTELLINPVTTEQVTNPQEYCCDWYEPVQPPFDTLPPTQFQEVENHINVIQRKTS